MTAHDTTVTLTANGSPWQGDVPANTLLADVLRDELRLTGTKIACDQAVCGACTVLVDGQPVAACTTFAFMADGAVVETIEGQAEDGALSAVQAAFKNHWRSDGNQMRRSLKGPWDRLGGGVALAIQVEDKANQVSSACFSV